MGERQKIVGVSFRMIDKRPKDLKLDHRKSVVLTGDKSARMRILKDLNCAFLEGMSQYVITTFCTKAVDRVFMPGEAIVVQGANGDSMYILISGTAGIYISKKDEDADHVKPTTTFQGRKSVSASKGVMGALQAGATKGQRQKVSALSNGKVFGELAMLGVIPTRGATIEAETMCFLWEINHKAIMPVLRECTELHDKFRTVICGHLEQSVTARFSGLPLFNDFGRSFQMLLSLYSDRRVHFPGQKIARGGMPGDGLYILNVGLAKLEKNRVVAKSLKPGHHFGATIMLGIHKNCIATVEAMEVCHVLVISRESYLMVLERYPSRDVDRELKASETRAYQQMQTTIKEATVRFQQMAHLSIKSPFNKEQTLDAKTAFLAWQSHVADRKAVRRREARTF